jgi:UDP-N-acetylglucosamine:LPS N-acetylglucosamine transferase
MSDNANNILFLYNDRRKKIKSDYGIPFECVELVRRFFNQYYRLTFPSISDAYQMFQKIDALIHTVNSQVVQLQTITAPNIQNIQVGDIIFWKRHEKNDNYGHVAIIVYSDDKRSVIAQQNQGKSLQVFETLQLIQKLNNKNGTYLGIKRLPNWLPKSEIIYVKVI